MTTSSIRLRLILAIVVVLAISGLASAGLVRVLYGRSARTAAEGALRGAASAYSDLERADIERMSAIVDSLLGNPELREAFAERDRTRLLAAALPIHQLLKTDHQIGHWNFIDADTKQMFLRVHLPAKHDDVVERASLLRAMSRREMSAGKELGKSAFALRVGKPLLAPDGHLIGYLELGEEVDHFLAKMKEQTGNDFAMFISKKLIDESEWSRTRGKARNGWADWADVVVVNATTTDPLVDQAGISGNAATGTILEEIAQGDSYYARGVFPVRDSSGATVGGLVVRHDITALRNDMRTALITAILFLVALAAAASVVVSVLVDRLIFRRLRALMGTMEDASTRLAGGDYAVGSSLPAVRPDEIGKFETFFAEFLAFVGNTLGALVERQRHQARPASPASPPARPASGGSQH